MDKKVSSTVSRRCSFHRTFAKDICITKNNVKPVVNPEKTVYIKRKRVTRKITLRAIVVFVEQSRFCKYVECIKYDTNIHRYIVAVSSNDVKEWQIKESVKKFAKKTNPEYDRDNIFLKIILYADLGYGERRKKGGSIYAIFTPMING